VSIKTWKMCNIATWLSLHVLKLFRVVYCRAEGIGVFRYVHSQSPGSWGGFCPNRPLPSVGHLRRQAHSPGVPCRPEGRLASRRAGSPLGLAAAFTPSQWAELKAPWTHVAGQKGSASLDVTRNDRQSLKTRKQAACSFSPRFRVQMFDELKWPMDKLLKLLVIFFSFALV